MPSVNGGVGERPYEWSLVRFLLQREFSAQIVHETHRIVANGAIKLEFSAADHVVAERVFIGSAGGLRGGRRIREDSSRLWGGVWGRGCWEVLM